MPGMTGGTGEEEVNHAGWFIFAVGALLVCGYYTVVEMTYTFWSKSANATITDTRQERIRTGRYGHSRPVLRVSFAFTEADGTLRSETEQVSVHWHVPKSGTVAIQYFPGINRSARIRRTGGVGYVVVFFASIAGLGFCGYRIWRMASDAVHGRSRRCM